MSSQVTDPLDQSFDVPLDKQGRQAVAKCIWGSAGAQCESDGILQSFFLYYNELTIAPTPPIYSGRSINASLRPLQSHGELARVVDIIGSNNEKPRSLLRQLIQLHISGEADPLIDIDWALDLAIRIILMVSCRSARKVFVPQHVIRPIWKDSESLEGYLERVLHQHDADRLGKAEAIKIKKLSVSYLNKYPRVGIKWTDNLLDHLLLDINETTFNKSVRIFRHVGFLETGLRAAPVQNHTQPTPQKSRGACLPSAFIEETVRTLLLLFPESDLSARKFIKQAITRDALDSRFTRLGQIVLQACDYSVESVPPEYTHDLFEQYPYWSDRLYKLLKEANDPSPTTWYEHWSDRKKSPRYTYWAGIIALALALFFGVLATILGALQVWISYCNWQGDAAGRVCKMHNRG